MKYEREKKATADVDEEVWQRVPTYTLADDRSDQRALVYQLTEAPRVALIATSRTRRRAQISSIRTPTRALCQTDVCTLLPIQRRVGVFRLASKTFTYGR